jgi:hypothetical protein
METLRHLPIANNFEALHAHMGSALWAVQGVEMLLSKYYATAFRLNGAPKQADIESEFEQHFAKTAGQLVGLIRDKRGNDDTTVLRLNAFVKERNWLAHRLRNGDLCFLDAKAFQDVLTRIGAIEAEAEALIQHFHSLMIEHFVGLGTPRDFIEQELAKEIFKQNVCQNELSP